MGATPRPKPFLGAFAAAIQCLYECFVCYILDWLSHWLLFVVVFVGPNYTFRRLVAKAY